MAGISSSSCFCCSAAGANRRSIPSLESLVNKCCEDYYINLEDHLTDVCSSPEMKYSEEEDKIYRRFQKYIMEAHCEENLKFLIEIYHYEKIWNMTFKRQSSILKCKEAEHHSVANGGDCKLNSLPTVSSSPKEIPSIDDAFDDGNDIEEEDDGGLSSPQSTTTATTDYQNLIDIPKVLKSDDDFDTNSFIDDKVAPAVTKKIRSMSSSSGNEAWTSIFKPEYCPSGTAEGALCLCSTHDDDEKIVKDNPPNIKQQLQDNLKAKFNHIITDYVLQDSPFEINLPNDVCAELVKEFNNPQILFHSPQTLLSAKNAVLQLLRENIYHRFCTEEESLSSLKAQDEIKELQLNAEREEKKQKAKQKADDDEEEANKSLNDLNLNASNSSNENKAAKGSTITQFLNKYHLKLNYSNSSASSSSSSITSSPISNELTAQTSNHSRSQQQNHRQHGDVHMVKGPCGIQPTANSYNPQPPASPPQQPHLKPRHSWGFKLSQKLRLDKSSDK